ncbi:YIP1 family protein [Massilia sp. TS11]|uniref:YIP1 family protein n=1 Tax=Massilia sp. TS11 TaxID=2908003 RepID=UPI001EDA0DB8|nr:YIP1 family protein [Massilia sp. TS11]MCG2583694.1 YIP1 family protein [Massilia sp. TS11]
MAFAQIAQIFYEPTAAFNALKEKPRAWLPLLLLIVSSAIIVAWYFQTVDMAWLIDRSLPPDFPAERRATAAQFMTRNGMLLTGLGGVVAGMPIVFALFGLYYTIAAKFTGMEISFGKGFALAAWSALPGLIGFPLMALQIATGHGQMAMQDANMLSLNFLLVHARPFTPWATFADSITVVTFWTIGLSVLGLRAWSGKSMATCVTVAVLPYAIWYGCWAAKIAFLG